LSKENEGLGVRRMREFNFALLGKWCWRMLVNKGGLWYTVLVARYGEVNGRWEVGGQGVPSFWKEVAKIRNGDGVEGEGWVEESIGRKIDNVRDTFFGQTHG